MIWHFILAHFAALATSHIILIVAAVAVLVFIGINMVAPYLFVEMPGTVIGGIATISCLVLWLLLRGQVSELQTEIYDPKIGYKVLIVNRDLTIHKQNAQLAAIAAEGAAKLKVASGQLATVQNTLVNVQHQILAIRRAKSKDACSDNIILENAK